MCARVWFSVWFERYVWFFVWLEKWWDKERKIRRVWWRREGHPSFFSFSFPFFLNLDIANTSLHRGLGSPYPSSGRGIYHNDHPFLFFLFLLCMYVCLPLMGIQSPCCDFLRVLSSAGDYQVILKSQPKIFFTWTMC